MSRQEELAEVTARVEAELAAMSPDEVLAELEEAAREDRASEAELKEEARMRKEWTRRMN